MPTQEQMKQIAYAIVAMLVYAVTLLLATQLIK